MSCTCQICGKKYKVDLIIPDGLWEIIKPEGKPEGGGLMCGSCIMERLETIEQYMALSAKGSLDCPLCAAKAELAFKNALIKYYRKQAERIDNAGE